MALLEITDLSTDIRLSKSTVHALDSVSIAVEAGETLGLVGESGSGKTMTALSIERLLPPGGSIVGGQVLFNGLDLASASEATMRSVRGGDIGMIFQDPMTSLNPVQTIGEQVGEPLVLHRGLSRSEANESVLKMFELVGLPNAAGNLNTYPHQMSGGQRQRVMIAMALICEPKLLIADEPTTALDVTIQKQILELIDRLRVELNMAMILVTHDLGVIAGRADRVAVMYAGKIAEMATTSTLFDWPRHRYTEALFEALPERAAGTGALLYSIPGLPPDLVSPPPACRFAPRCRFATDVCRTVVPTLEAVALKTGVQEFACFVPCTEPLGSAEELAAKHEAASATVSDPLLTENREWVAPKADMPATSQPLLQLESLVKDFPVTAGAIARRKVGAISAVAEVSLSIGRGQTLGLVGESGCGKTTLGRLVVGLEKPTSGRILFRGRPVESLRGKEAREGRRNVQFMFQDSYASLDPRMRVRAVLREPLEIQRVGTARDRNTRVDELLDAVGLPRSSAERYPHEFSGGQRQRIGLARALALQPALIVADEPVSALDVSIQAQVLNLMKELQRERELTYLFISHDLSVVRYLSDVIAVMYLGKLVEIGSAVDVYSRPNHHYTRGLIDTIPVADPAVEKQKTQLGVRGELPSAMNPPSGCRFRTRCPAAQEICARVEPPLQVGGGGIRPHLLPEPTGPASHLVACHFPLNVDSVIHKTGKVHI
ncbi:ABC transporter ATP-binding protein [Glaciibacter psychrotolerans]|uniref:Peptide/nickel transport system ATP-binding protein n=1 Tax=Glaciibacter psychrotolerans TaxID=670054 RepID=A0A7Z0EDJ6_9MICO|nr:ABC transporter ATP-binding protein [Leifsonia psychrotolerans]NYJ19650.1 peptide/nickel transport system ATP-binding protein [Leifsonia psychrotolerans]